MKTKLYQRLILLIPLCVLLYCLFVLSKRVEHYEEFTDGPDRVPDVSFPFKNIYDDKDRKLPIICIGAPFRNNKHKTLYETYKNNGLYFLGSTSYQEFPGTIINPYEDPYYNNNEDNYENLVKTWIHCFRNPNEYFKQNTPKMLLSESDFIDPEQLQPNPNQVKIYDFIYICLDEGINHDATGCKPGWQAHNRNWELAKKCLHILCGTFHLKGLIIGRTDCEITDLCTDRITSMPFQPQNKFFELLQQCKWIFVPNVSDASPRVVTQAMCYNMPVLMNRNIVGGWKYIDSETTGRFFTDETDLTESLKIFINNFNNYTPRKFYMDHYGKVSSGKQFLTFLKEHYVDVDFQDAEYAFFKKL